MLVHQQYRCYLLVFQSFVLTCKTESARQLEETRMKIYIKNKCKTLKMIRGNICKQKNECKVHLSRT